MTLDALYTTTGIAAMVTAVVAGWQYVKGFSRYIASLLLLQKSCDFPISSAVSLHLREQYSRLPSGMGSYRSIKENVDDKQYKTTVPFEMPSSTTIWFGKRGAFLVTLSNLLTIVSLRKFSDPQGLVLDALEGMDKRLEDSMKLGSGNFFVKQVIGSVGVPPGYDSHNRKGSNRSSGAIVGSQDGDELSSDPSPNDHPQDVGTPDRLIDKSFRFPSERYIKNRSNEDPLRGLFYKDDVIQLLADLKRWYMQRQWYQDRGIPWRMGCLFHGPGGTGKSSLSRAAAQTLGIPLYQYCLNTLTDRDFVEKWGNMRAPCVVALEDFDTVFHGRESVTTHQSLSFECVLNQISGISALNGVLLIVTTNHMEHIDEAMGQLDDNGRPTRPGRIDRILYLGETDEKQRREIAEYTLDWAIDLIDEMVAKGENTMPAQFQDMCITAALDRISKQQKEQACPKESDSSHYQKPQLRLLKS